MADGRELYIFSFGDITGSDEANAIDDGIMFANLPAPTIVLEQGQEVYLSLTNVGMVLRPDLSDAHTVHFHGFPNASAIFDGLPDTAISINLGSTMTYYYNLAQPGTFMYHCHVEASEHMQMGMLGNLYVKAAQNKLPDGTNLNGFIHNAGNEYVYNDGDGSTFYDVEYPIQLTGMDPDFHDANETVQPLPFANMKDKYPLINGRGYPDTVIAGPLPAPVKNGGLVTQTQDSNITAVQGQKILLRVSSLSVTRFYSLKSLGLDMQVVGMGAKPLRTAADTANPYTTNTITLGGGEAIDVIIDTTGVAPGKYFLYTSNLNNLSNNTEDFGGMMTEIEITL
ncbi:MAG TPA: multicopper oxidase family protein [Gammaproteobacteria bacterium]|nr:multicopper oxidase family protein [Gammaproteobacteria bacterium]